MEFLDGKRCMEQLLFQSSRGGGKLRWIKQGGQGRRSTPTALVGEVGAVVQGSARSMHVPPSSQHYQRPMRASRGAPQVASVVEFTSWHVCCVADLGPRRM